MIIDINFGTRQQPTDDFKAKCVFCYLFNRMEKASKRQPRSFLILLSVTPWAYIYFSTQYSRYKHINSQTFIQIFIFRCSLVEIWTVIFYILCICNNKTKISQVPKQPTRNKRKYFCIFLASTQDLSDPSLLPCHLSHHTSPVLG